MLSITRRASSTFTPARFSGASLGFVGFSRGLFFTISLSRPSLLHESVNLPVNRTDSDRLLVRQPFACNRADSGNQSAPVRHLPRVPTECERVGVFGQMLPGDVMPRANHAAHYFLIKLSEFLGFGCLASWPRSTRFTPR